MRSVRRCCATPHRASLASGALLTRARAFCAVPAAEEEEASRRRKPLLWKELGLARLRQELKR